MKTDKKPLSLFEDHSKEKYLSVFLTSFLISAVVFLLLSLAQRGPFIYYGDYNMQQIPFYYHVHEAVKSGRFMWDFSTDLGTDLMESYSFYLMGSPFFWMTVPFPSAALPYIMPWMLSLKTAVAALTAYAYIRGFTNNTAACFMGGLLYAFSGFQIYNLMFNHFHDATAFFPLLLLASDRLAMKKDKGLFGAAVLLCAVTNYFFFAEMAVFTVIYYVVNISVGRYKFTVKGFINYGFEAVLGVCAAAVVLLPSAGAVMGNNRAASHITPEYMLIYRNTLSTYIHIIKGFFTLPDLCLFHALPSSDEIECSSVSAYLPFVSVCGVFGYFARKPKKDMPAAMFVISLICMAVPVLNSMFYMFNISYYARWFFMPILIMCVMTAVTVSEDVMLLKKSILPCMGVNAVILIGGLIYKGTVKTSALDSEGTVNTTYLTYITVGSIGCLALLYSMLSDKSLTDNKARLTALNKRVSAACAVIMLASVSLGVAAFRDSKNYRNFFFGSIDDVEELKNSDENSGLFFRTETCESYRNSNFMWDTSSSVSFISLIPQSMTEFYDKIGFPRGVVTTTIPNYESLRAMLSVKYYFDMPLEIDGQMLPPYDKLFNSIESFDFKEKMGGMLCYENNCFIPMGFTYDYYTTEDELKKIDNRYFEIQALLETLVVEDEQISRFEEITEKYDNQRSYYDHDGLKRICDEKSASACDSFVTDNKGFSAHISLDSPKPVFFSVPYSKYWLAYINGEPVQIEKVNYGFMAVICPEGESDIRFDYVNTATLYGLYISIGAIIILIVYAIAAKKFGARCKDAENK